MERVLPQTRNVGNNQVPSTFILEWANFVLKKSNLKSQVQLFKFWMIPKALIIKLSFIKTNPCNNGEATTGQLIICNKPSFRVENFHSSFWGTKRTDRSLRVTLAHIDRCHFCHHHRQVRKEPFSSLGADGSYVSFRPRWLAIQPVNSVPITTTYGFQLCVKNLLLLQFNYIILVLLGGGMVCSDRTRFATVLPRHSSEAKWETLGRTRFYQFRPVGVFFFGFGRLFSDKNVLTVDEERKDDRWREETTWSV